MTIVDFIPSSTVSVSTRSSTSTGGSSRISTESGTASGEATSAAGSTGTAASVVATASASAQSSSLSGGAKAGIGIGIAVIVIALIAGVAFWIVKRMRRGETQKQGNHSATTGELPINGHQHYIHEKYTPHHVAEADSSTSGSVYNKPQHRLHEMG